MKNKIHVVYKTHLDIGFTDLAENVMGEYINNFIPRAIDLGEKMKGKFIWTTGSWLINYYLTNPCVDENAKKRMRSAIENGYIKWHGLPVTTHTELMDKKLFEYGLSLSKKLDKEFGTKTISGKMTDVPGHTIAIVPMMVEAGLKYLHIGVNESSAMPDVPEIFVWRAKDGSEIIVHYAKYYGTPFEKEDWNDRLYFAHTHDNQGPPRDEREINELFSILEEKYPDTEIVASTLDDFAEVAWKMKDTLPVIEEEIADSWIYGIASDPKKVAKYELLLRLRDKWIEDKSMDINSEEYKKFSSELLLIPEHTWGASGVKFLPDYRNYLIDDFKKAREKNIVEVNNKDGWLDFADSMENMTLNNNLNSDVELRRYSLYEASWDEQRAYLDKAVEALSDIHKKEAIQVFNEFEIYPEEVTGESVIFDKIYKFENLEIIFGNNGSIKKLKSKGVDWLKYGKQFGAFSYERFDFNDFSRFLKGYSRIDQGTGTWVFADFAKRGIEAFKEINHEIIGPYVDKSSMKSNDNEVIVIFEMKFNEKDERAYGLPKKITLKYVIDRKHEKINGELYWRGKEANRMPEAFWLECSISVNNPYRWTMYKMGQAISPYNVVRHGNRNMHVLSKEGLIYNGAEGKAQITSVEAPMFSFGRRSLLHFDDQQLSLNEGIYVNLFNNVWGTNFTAWCEDDMRYKFEVNLNTY